MQISEQQQGAVRVLRPEGALVEEHVGPFREKLAEAHRQAMGRVVVDMSGVPFVDSEGLEALLDETEQMARQGRALRLCGVNETVREALDLTEMLPHFEQYADAHEATRSFL